MTKQEYMNCERAAELYHNKEKECELLRQMLEQKTRENKLLKQQLGYRIQRDAQYNRADRECFAIVSARVVTM